MAGPLRPQQAAVFAISAQSFNLTTLAGTSPNAAALGSFRLRVYMFEFR